MVDSAAHWLPSGFGSETVRTTQRGNPDAEPRAAPGTCSVWVLCDKHIEVCRSPAVPRRAQKIKNPPHYYVHCKNKGQNKARPEIRPPFNFLLGAPQNLYILCPLSLRPVEVEPPPKKIRL